MVPAGETVEDVVARARASVMAVEPAQDGTPAGTVPDMVDRAVHRVVQEALTNAARTLDGPPDGSPPEPPGTDACVYYRTTDHALYPVYRLCFDSGRLTTKDVLDRLSPGPGPGSGRGCGSPTPDGGSPCPERPVRPRTVGGGGNVTPSVEPGARPALAGAGFGIRAWVRVSHARRRFSVP
ncbi:hypothetical protein [Streptomyces sp. NPDC001970]